MTVIVNKKISTVQVTKKVLTVIASTVGVQGPAGVGAILQCIADSPVNGHRVVAEVGAGRVSHADLNVESHGDLLLGISFSASTGGVSVVTSGPMSDPSFNFTAGLPLFCGPGGVITHAPSAPPSKWSCCVGVATSTTSIQIQIEPPIFLE